MESENQKVKYKRRLKDNTTQLKTRSGKGDKIPMLSIFTFGDTFFESGEMDSFSLVVVKQLMRSASSVGANVIEAKNSSSRLEFKRYYEIALKSCNESKYWICLLRWI